jgi:hypothetical protein
MEEKTHQNLKTSVGRKSSNGEMVSGRAIKERKGWESSERGKRVEMWGRGRDSPASTQSQSEPGMSYWCPLLPKLQEWRAGSRTYVPILGFGTICYSERRASTGFTVEK